MGIGSNNMKSSIWFAGLLAASFITVASSALAEDGNSSTAEKTVVFKVDGMTCGNCEKAINKQVLATKGVAACKADHKAGTAAVTFDAAQVDAARIEKVIDRLGFDASVPAAP